jgi:hypothetical protein
VDDGEEQQDRRRETQNDWEERDQQTRQTAQKVPPRAQCVLPRHTVRFCSLLSTSSKSLNGSTARWWKTARESEHSGHRSSEVEQEKQREIMNQSG